MSGKDCSDSLESLYSYIDGELSDEQLLRVSEHLEECPPCDEERAVHEKIKNMVACCGDELAPSELREKILAAIAGQRDAS